MSEYNLNEVEGDWRLIRRNERVEMWHNHTSGKYGVYLYEHTQRDEYWLLYGIRDTEEDALEKFDAVVRLLG